MNLSKAAKQLSETAPQRRKVEALEKAERKSSQRIKEQDRRIKELEKLVEHQADRIERFNKARYKLPRSAARTSSKGSFIRLVIPDTHGCLADDSALAAMFADVERLADRIKEVVLLGDHLDCGGFLAQHHTLGYVAQSSYTFTDDCNAANLFLDRLQSICKQASFDYIEGNHEWRVEKWCVTQALANESDAKYLLNLFAPWKVLHLESRGIKYYRRCETYDGLSIPGTIKRGNCHFTHGISTSKHAAKAHLDAFAANVAYAHTHRGDFFASRTVADGTIAAWNPGCLCKLQPMYMHTNPTTWVHGYALQSAQANGDFLHINVPIINGKSYLGQLFEA
jgi:hypothetical protein